MRYWPQSVIVTSPLIQSHLAHEWGNASWVCPSKDAFLAGLAVASQTEAIDAPNLSVVHTVDAPVRRLFTDYPGTREWLRLERVCIVEDSNGFMFGMVDALH